MKPIKHPHDGNGTTPQRWVYRAENTIIKTIPHAIDPDSIPEQPNLLMMYVVLNL